MKLKVISIIGAILLGSLSAQTQSLPDLRISGESDVRTYLYKRSLQFSQLSTFTDSLPVFIPQGDANEHSPIEPGKGFNTGYLQLEGNSGFGLNSYFSLYPQAASLYSVSHHMTLRAPETYLMSFQNNLTISGVVTTALPISLQINHTNTKARNYKGSYFDTSITHHRAELLHKDVLVSDIHVGIGISNLRQEVFNDNFDKGYINLNVSDRLRVSALDIQTKILNQDGEAGFQIAPMINKGIYNVDNVRFHLLADAYRTIPSIEFHYKHQLGDTGLFSIRNEPAIESISFTSLLEKGPWIQFGNDYKLEKSPLNLKTLWEFKYPLASDFSLSRIVISNNSRYYVHSPLLSSSITYGVPTVQYVDMVKSDTGIEAYFSMKNFSFYQDIRIDLAYLPKQSMNRIGYIPILSLKTNADYYYRDWVFSADLIQDYFTKDHQGKDMSEVVNGNLGFEYRKDNSALYAVFSNIFNHRQWIFTEHPSQKRSIYMGLKHRF